MSQVKLPKDAKSSSSSEGSSSSSSYVDMKYSEKRSRDVYQQTGSGRRSRSHLGRNHSQEHFHKNHGQSQKRCLNMLTVYNSDEDLHSSSTDSYSVSHERYPTHIANCRILSSSIDLTGEERSSGSSSSASAYSRYSPAVFTRDANDVWSKHARRHFFVETMYRRPISEQFSTDEYSNNSQDDDEDEIRNVAAKNAQNNRNKIAEKKYAKQQKNKSSKMSICDVNVISNENVNSESSSSSSSKRSSSNTSTSRSRSISPCSITKGLHLSRISITSSVCRMFQHLTTSSSTSTTKRSLSCNSTPLRGNIKQKACKASITSQPKNNNYTKNSNRTKSASVAALTATPKKKEKKQQSILRQPVHFVYMKGMSGLYSRVPRYTVCRPYNT